jgi:sulfite reductase alpha subunit-like flavoprotein
MLPELSSNATGDGSGSTSAIIFYTASLVTVGAVALATIRTVASGWSRAFGSSADSSNSKSSAGSAADEGRVLKTRIYFGSQTGTAERFAYELQRSLEKIKSSIAKGKLSKVDGAVAAYDNVFAEVVDLEEFDSNTFIDGLAGNNTCGVLNVFVVATYGEGDSTDNATGFNKWQVKESKAIKAGSKSIQFAPTVGSPTASKPRLEYCVCSLGNRQYAEFCAMGIRTDQCLEALGGNRVIPNVECDDDGDIEADFATWKLSFYSYIARVLGVDEKKAIELIDLGHSKVPSSPTAGGGAVLNLVMSMDKDKKKLPFDASVFSGGENAISKFYFNAIDGRVTDVKELRQKPDVAAGQTTVHLTIDLTDASSASGALRAKYNLADNLEVSLKQNLIFFYSCCLVMMSVMSIVFCLSLKSMPVIFLPLSLLPVTRLVVRRL